jgi:hypothetical protein
VKVNDESSPAESRLFEIVNKFTTLFTILARAAFFWGGFHSGFLQPPSVFSIRKTKSANYGLFSAALCENLAIHTVTSIAALVLPDW